MRPFCLGVTSNRSIRQVQSATLDATPRHNDLIMATSSTTSKQTRCDDRGGRADSDSARQDKTTYNDTKRTKRNVIDHNGS